MAFALYNFWCKVLRSATECPCPGRKRRKKTHKTNNKNRLKWNWNNSNRKKPKHTDSKYPTYAYIFIVYRNKWKKKRPLRDPNDYFDDTLQKCMEIKKLLVCSNIYALIFLTTGVVLYPLDYTLLWIQQWFSSRKLQTLGVHGLLLTGPVKGKLTGLLRQKEKCLFRKNKGKRRR